MKFEVQERYTPGTRHARLWKHWDKVTRHYRLSAAFRAMKQRQRWNDKHRGNCSTQVRVWDTFKDCEVTS